MKRMLSMLLCLALLLPLAACVRAESIGETGPAESAVLDEELERAVDCGLVTAGELTDLEGAVTWKRFCELLGGVIGRYDSAAGAEWTDMTSGAPDEEMRRDGAMVALLFAAKAAGMAGFNAQAPEAFGGYADRVWEVVSMDYPVFDWNTPIDLGDGCSDNNHVGPAYDFCLRRVSMVSGKPLLEFDGQGDLRLEQPLTLREAVQAALRLYESDEETAAAQLEAETATLLASPEVQGVLARADALRANILETENAIVKGDTFVKGETYSGAAYYVSNRGSDSNDGRSPETAFATPAALEGVELQYGDAVFFERGSVWRMASLPASAVWTAGVTFSAYGEGAKPQFLGSQENGTGGEKWSLAYEGGDGKKIWVFYTDMTEVAGIVLNNETIVNRDKAYWDGREYWVVDESYWPLEEGVPYRVEECLPDLYCFPALVYSEDWQSDSGERIFHTWNSEEGRYDYVTGKLYFRCDAGNPGELFESIEFIQPYPFVDGFADDQVYDNLCIRYSSMTFTSGGWEGMPSGNGAVIQNMEVGWMGGNVTGYTPDPEPDDIIQFNCGSMGCNGGGIAINGSGVTVRNNYVHHAFQEGIALETFSGTPSMEGCVVTGNLIEYCTQGLLLCNWDEEVDPDHIFSQLSVTENIVLFSGEENWFNYDCELEICSAVVLQGGPCAHDGTVFVNHNTIAFATGALIQIDEYSEAYSRIFMDNTYVQLPGARGIRLAHGGAVHALTEAPELLGDTAALVPTP